MNSKENFLVIQRSGSYKAKRLAMFVELEIEIQYKALKELWNLTRIQISNPAEGKNPDPFLKIRKESSLALNGI